MTPEINREQYNRIQEEFGQDGEPLGHPRVYLTDTGLQVEFGEGESHVGVWATQQSTRVDAGDLSLYVSTERSLLLRRVGPFPIRRWKVLYDSDSQERSEDVSFSEPVTPEPPSSGLVSTEDLLKAYAASLQAYDDADQAFRAAPTALNASLLHRWLDRLLYLRDEVSRMSRFSDAMTGAQAEPLIQELLAKVAEAKGKGA